MERNYRERIPDKNIVMTYGKYFEDIEERNRIKLLNGL